MNDRELILSLRKHGHGNGGALGKHMSICDVAADRIEELTTGEDAPPCEYCTPGESNAYGYAFGKDFPNDGGSVAVCILWDDDGRAAIHAEAWEEDDGTEVCIGTSDCPIFVCPICGRRLSEHQ